MGKASRKEYVLYDSIYMTFNRVITEIENRLVVAKCWGGCDMKYLD